MRLNHLPSLELVHIKNISLPNWLSFLPQFHLNLASFLIKSSRILIFRLGWVLSIINALFKISGSVHAFFHSASIRQAATKCQAVKRTLRWLRRSLSGNFTYSPRGSRPGSVSQFSTTRTLQGGPGCWPAGTLSTTGCHRTEKHLKRRSNDKKEYPDGSGIRCSKLRGKCLQELRRRGQCVLLWINSCWAVLRGPTLGCQCPVQNIVAFIPRTLGIRFPWQDIIP